MIDADYVPNNIGAKNIKRKLVPFNINMKLVSYNIKMKLNTRLNNRTQGYLSVVFILFPVNLLNYELCLVKLISFLSFETDSVFMVFALTLFGNHP